MLLCVIAIVCCLLEPCLSSGSKHDVTKNSSFGGNNMELNNRDGSVIQVSYFLN